MSSHDLSYIGTELDLFAEAVNWKNYWGTKIRPYLGKEILEVGAGIGATTLALCTEDYTRWLGLEPDLQMSQQLQRDCNAGKFPPYCQFIQGTLTSLADSEMFDSIIYIDVLEHIEHDHDEVAHAAQHVVPGGYLIILAPAYQFLYSEFDASIGHYRRYTRETLKRLTPRSFEQRRFFYLDALGLLTSLVNRFMLHAPLPTREQIHLWDRLLVPLSRILDPLVLYSFGRSAVIIWQRTSND